MPDFQIDEQPQPIVVTRAAAPVLVGQLTQGVRIEESARSRTRSQNELLDHRPEAAAQPAADRYGKSHLATREDRRRHDVPHCGPKYRLGCPSSQLEPSWHRGDVL